MWLNERVVDGDNIDIIVLNSVTEDNASDTAETVNSNLDWCHVSVKIDVRTVYYGSWQASAELARAVMRGRLGDSNAEDAADCRRDARQRMNVQYLM